MAKKITELTAIAALTEADLIAVVDDADVSTKKASMQQVRTKQVNARVAAYTLAASDAGKIVTVDTAGPVDVTVPALGAGFSCSLVQLGAGQVSVIVSGTTIRNRQGHAKIAGQYGHVQIEFHLAAEFILSGDTAA